MGVGAFTLQGPQFYSSLEMFAPAEEGVYPPNPGGFRALHCFQATNIWGPELTALGSILKS